MWGRGFPCQPYRDSEVPVVSGPLIGRHSPAVLIPYAQAQAEGVGAFVNAISLNQIMGVFANVWRCLHECLFMKVAGGGPQTGEI